jgi:hypothetical protein
MLQLGTKRSKAAYINERCALVVGKTAEEAVGMMVPNSKGSESCYSRSDLQYDLKGARLALEGAAGIPVTVGKAKRKAMKKPQTKTKLAKPGFKFDLPDAVVARVVGYMSFHDIPSVSVSSKQFSSEIRAAEDIFWKHIAQKQFPVAFALRSTFKTVSYRDLCRRQVVLKQGEIKHEPEPSATLENYIFSIEIVAAAKKTDAEKWSWVGNAEFENPGMPVNRPGMGRIMCDVPDEEVASAWAFLKKHKFKDTTVVVSVYERGSGKGCRLLKGKPVQVSVSNGL